jgi:hypothetical protein
MVSHNTWKYLSIALMAVLAVGFSFPQAFAHVTSSLTHNFGHVLDAVNAIKSDIGAIKAKTNNLPTDPASNSVVNTRSSQTSVDDLQSKVDTITSQTDKIPVDPATEASVNTRSSQESVDNLQFSIDAIATDVQDVLGKVDTDQMFLRWQFSGTFQSSTRAVVLKEDAYSGVASFTIRTLPDADGDGDSHDCEVSETGVEVDTDKNGQPDTNVFIRDGAQFGGAGGGFIPAGTDQIFVSGASVNGHADCFFEINLLVEVKN